MCFTVGAGEVHQLGVCGHGPLGKFLNLYLLDCFWCSLVTHGLILGARRVQVSGGFRGGKGGANAPPFGGQQCIFAYITARVRGMKQQQPGTVHSRISSLLISRRLTRPRVASRYSVWTYSYFKQLTSYLPVSSDNNYVCYECVNVPKVGVATPKILECASCTSG